RGRPLEAVLQLLAALAHGHGGVDADVLGHARAVVVAGDDTAVLAAVDDLRVERGGGREAGLAAADAAPVGAGDAGGVQAVARAGCGAEVLHGPRDVVGRAVVRGDVVELAQGQRRGVPGSAAVGGNVHAAVVAVNHAPRVGRVDPQVVVVAVVRAANGLEVAAAVDALQQRHLRGPDHVGGLWGQGGGGGV